MAAAVVENALVIDVIAICHASLNFEPATLK